MIENSSYYAMQKRFNERNYNYDYGGSFYTVDGVFIKHVIMDKHVLTYEKLPELDRLLDPKCVGMARPSTVVFTKTANGKFVCVVDKNNVIIARKQYDGPMDKMGFIEHQMHDTNNPIQVDYKWLMCGDVRFVDSTKVNPRSNNKDNSICTIL